MSDHDVPDEAWVLALASLDGMGPARLRALVAEHGARGAFDDAIRAAGSARRPDVARLWQRHVDAGVGVAAMGSSAFPEPLVADVDPPALVVWRGSLDALHGPRVAVVGTRDCTVQGRDVAFELGRDLASAGVRIVSGLALGIDGAAHAGAIEAGGAPPIGVVGTGLDVVYPKQNGSLWRRVAERGLLLTEWPLGTPGAAWRFPARNRLIAALADIVVVVESHESGGALSTAEQALKRGRSVMAFPGSVRNPASAGTNKLIYDGSSLCRGAADVLVLLGLDSAAARRRAPRRPAPSPEARAVLDAIGWVPAATEQLLLRTGLGLGELARHLDELEEAGWVVRRGGWYERREAVDAS